jgi:Transposase DDE domain group 1
MQTECSAKQLEFEGFAGRRVVAAFDGGAMTSDVGALLLREADRAIGLSRRVSACSAIIATRSSWSTPCPP